MEADRQGLSGKGASSLSSRQCRTVERVLVSAITGGGFSLVSYLEIFHLLTDLALDGLE